MDAVNSFLEKRQEFVSWAKDNPLPVCAVNITLLCIALVYMVVKHHKLVEENWRLKNQILQKK